MIKMLPLPKHCCPSKSRGRKGHQSKRTLDYYSNKQWHLFYYWLCIYSKRFDALYLARGFPFLSRLFSTSVMKGRNIWTVHGPAFPLTPCETLHTCSLLRTHLGQCPICPNLPTTLYVYLIKDLTNAAEPISAGKQCESPYPEIRECFWQSQKTIPG